MARGLYVETFEAALKNDLALDMDNDTFKCMLVTASYTPNFETHTNKTDVTKDCLTQSCSKFVEHKNLKSTATASIRIRQGVVALSRPPDMISAHARLTRYARRALVGRLNRLPTWLDKTE